jgi:O-6-methylguanine DNA methyltransferase
MKTPAPQQWIVTRIDGRIASVAADYRHLAAIAARVASLPPASVGEVRTEKVPTEGLPALDASVQWEDLRLFGSKFQQRVWKRLYDLTHDGTPLRLHSYTELASLCDNPQGIRAVAHAVACNPVAYIIPCHLIVPKESIDKAAAIRENAESTLFKGSDLYLLDKLDVGDFAYGPALKRSLIKLQLAR